MVNGEKKSQRPCFMKCVFFNKKSRKKTTHGLKKNSRGGCVGKREPQNAQHVRVGLVEECPPPKVKKKGSRVQSLVGESVGE